MTINIADLRATLGLDTRPLHKGVLQAKGEVAGLKGSFSGLAGALGGLLGGAAVVAGFQKAINATADWGREVKSLGRTLGVSTTQASDLAVAAAHFGLDAEQVSRGLGIFTKHIIAGDAASKSLGVTFRDSKGQLLPFNEILNKTADRFKALPDGAQKTALALNLFGRSGKQLIPLLSQGAAGLAKFHEEAKKFGLELSGKDVVAITNFKFAQRDLGLALKGIEVQLGLKVIPVFTQFLKIGASFVAEINKIPGPVLAVVGGFGALVVAVKLGARVVGAVADAFKVARTAVVGLASAFGPATAAQEGANAATAASTATTKEAAIAARLKARAAKEATLQDIAQARAAGALGISQAELATAMGAEATAAQAAAGEQAKLAAIAAQLGISETEAAAAFTGTAAGEALAATAAKDLAASQEAAAASTLGTAGAMDAFKASLGPIAIGAGLVAAIIAKIALSGGAAKGAIEGLTSALGGTEAAFRSQVITEFAKNFKTEFQDISKLAPQAQKKILDFVESGQKFSFFGRNGAQAFKDLKVALQEAFPNAGEFAIDQKANKIAKAMNGMSGATKEARAQFEAQKTALEADTAALDNLEGGFQSTIELNTILKQLVAKGVPQQLADQFKSMGADGLTAAQQLNAGTQEDVDSFINLARAAGAIPPILQKQDTALDKLDRQYQHASNSVDHFSSTLKITLGGLLDVQSTTSQYDADLASLGESLKANGRTFDLNTAKGRDNSQALRTLVGDIEDEIGALVRSGRASQDETAQKNLLIQKLQAVANKYPALRTQIQAYINQIKKTPVEHTTTMKAKADLKSADKAAQNLINHFDTRFDKEGGVPIGISPQFLTSTINVTADTVNLSGVGGHMAGGFAEAGKLAIFGEQGPELAIPSVGMNILTAAQTKAFLSGRRGTDGAQIIQPKTVNVTINNPKAVTSEASMFLELRKLTYLGVL